MSRRIRACLASFVCVAVLVCQRMPAGADSPSQLPSPARLAVNIPGSSGQLSAGGWTSSSRIEFQFQAGPSIGPVTPQVEVVHLNQAFTNRPTAAGKPFQGPAPASVQVQNLPDGRYRWQARVIDNAGESSAWVPFSAPGTNGADFGVDKVAPTRPVISSQTNPSQNAWYNSAAVKFAWSSTDSLSGIKGYTYQVEQTVAHVIPPGPATQQTGLNLRPVPQGVTILAVRAEDRAGNWSPTGTFRLLIDRTSPRFAWLSPRRVTLNPFQGGTTLRFTVSKDSAVTLTLYRVGSARAVRVFKFPHVTRNTSISVGWNGRVGAGKPAPRGFYFFSATAQDSIGNVARVNLGGIDLNPQPGVKSATGQTLFPNSGKQIFVSLARETLFAYQGTKLVMQTFVTTGNPNLPTPPGTYTIQSKFHPYEFISPWPQGSPYWYPPSLSQYAMLFRSGGYFLHDAPWRSAFGPGTNGPGQPGTNYGGTHGCVNIPPGPTFFLWNWAPVGTPVIVS